MIFIFSYDMFNNWTALYQIMNNDQDQFNILDILDKNKNTTQRKLADKLGFSLGKMNYLLKSLNKKGLIKINRFKKNQKKIGYLYILTPSGISKEQEWL